MKRRNKMKVASLVLCGALLTGIVLTPVGAKAETIEGTGKAQSGTASVDGDEGLTAVEVPIEASTTGSDIVYNITVTYGAMKFNYCYGRTWNPNTHTYSPGTVGWNPDDLDGEKNKITVKNDSNIPVKATFTVADQNALREAFNETSGSPSPNDVHGNFSTSNSTFISGGNVTSQVKEGNVAYSPANLSLEMDASQLESGTTYYRVMPGIAQDAQDQQNIKNMYFALVGKPNKNIAEAKEVGKIKVTITPEEGLTAKIVE